MSSITSVIGPFGSGPGGGGGGPPASDPYAWYPTLDLANIPFHVAAGASTASGGYGAQTVVTAPTGPSFVDEVTLTSGQPGSNPPAGRRYIVGANLGDVSISGTAEDIDFVLPEAYSIGKLTISGAGISRVRIRGTTPGTLSGGIIRGIDINGSGPNVLNDIIIDGVRVASPAGNGASELCLITSDTINKMAIVNCRFRAAQAIFTGGNIAPLVWAGNSFEAGAYSTGQCPDGVFPPFQQWSMRHNGYGPIIVFDNDIRGRRFGRFRAATTTGTPGDDRLIWVDSNLFMSDQEGNIASCGILSGTDIFRGAWFTNNDCYGYGGAKIDMERAIYARLTGNRIYMDTVDSSFMSTQQSNHTSYMTGISQAVDLDYTTGNTYSAYPGRPAWTRAGNPSDISMTDGTIYDAVQHAQDFDGYIP